MLFDQSEPEDEMVMPPHERVPLRWGLVHFQRCGLRADKPSEDAFRHCYPGFRLTNDNDATMVAA